MKAMYIKPELEITITLVEGHLCGNSDPGLRKADWGAKGVNDYSNAAWDNQGWGNSSTPVEIAGDDNGELNSTGNHYNLWEDEM